MSYLQILNCLVLLFCFFVDAGPGGDLRVYLEGLAMANNVQEYVASHPFGQPAITKSDPNWDFYCRVLGNGFNPHKKRLNAIASNTSPQ